MKIQTTPTIVQYNACIASIFFPGESESAFSSRNHEGIGEMWVDFKSNGFLLTAIAGL